MRRFIAVMMIVCLVALVAGCAQFKDRTREIVVKADNLATENEAIVEKLVLDRQSVTADEEAIAIRNARALKILTGTLADVVD